MSFTARPLDRSDGKEDRIQLYFFSSPLFIFRLPLVGCSLSFEWSLLIPEKIETNPRDPIFSGI